MSVTATNPVLPGCFPDPSVVRVGEDYYLASSSFAYFPAIPLHHSRDLVHWRPIGHAVDRAGRLDLAGVRASGGLYAPTLRYAAGRFHLVCTVVGGLGRSGNFLVSATTRRASGRTRCGCPRHRASTRRSSSTTTAPPICSAPANCPAPAGAPRSGCAVSTWSRASSPAPTGALPRRAGDARWAEGPHLYKVGGWYVLLLAEGGTAYQHAVTVARSRTVEGPYENNPGNPVLTHRHLGQATRCTAWATPTWSGRRPGTGTR